MRNKRVGRRNVALIYGGVGVEREVSVRGKEYISGLIDTDKFIVYPIFIAEDGAWYHDTPEGDRIPTFPTRMGKRRGLLLRGRITEVHAALPFLHGDMGEDGNIQGALTTAGIPFVGAETVTGAVCIDKAYTKAIAEQMGIPTARWICLNASIEPMQARLLAEKSIGYPMFIKPARLGSSVGAHAVLRRENFIEAFSDAGSVTKDGILIEELITNKREIEVAYFGTKEQTLLSYPAEVLCSDFYDYRKKYGAKTPTLCHAELTEDILGKIHRYCRLLADRLELRHLGRIDFFLDGERIIFNEINTMPGFTEDSLYPRMLEAAGIPPSRLINLLIEDCIAEGVPV